MGATVCLDRYSNQPMGRRKLHRQHFVDDGTATIYDEFTVSDPPQRLDAIPGTTVDAFLGFVNRAIATDALMGASVTACGALPFTGEN